MKATRYIRSASVLASAALILGAFVAPADAKKKKPKPPPPPPACAPFAPGELGAGAPTNVVKETATADAPVEVKVATDAGAGTGGTGNATADGVLGSEISHAIQNVQVDTPADATLFVRLEMPAHTDYDLFVYDAAGEAVAQAAGFNPEPTVYNDDTHGGHTEKGAEVIDGLASVDCAGYTLDIAGASTPGGEVTLKLWVE